MDESARRELLISNGWIQAIVIVVVCGFLILGMLAYRTYTDEPPIPARVVDPSGQVIFTGVDVIAGQEVFLRNGLMEYGSIFGHGAYLGPDFTADYLHRAALIAIDHYGGLSSEAAKQQTIDDFKTNRYDGSLGSASVFSRTSRKPSRSSISTMPISLEPRPRSTDYGRLPSPIRQQIRQLTAFFSWSAWAGSTLRPNLNYSYTNNWPPEPLVANHATADAVVWSVLSLIALLGGIGLLLAAFGRWNFLGWHGREDQRVSFRPPDEVVLTPAQRSCAWFFLVMALLFCLQALLGGATQHYRAEIANFFGFDLARILPFNIARTWHLQLAIFWVSTSFLAAGIFLAPMITGREPRRTELAFLRASGCVGDRRFGEFGRRICRNQWLDSARVVLVWEPGFEYLDLGRFWQILLTVGLVFWVIILFRGLRGRLGSEHVGNMPWLFFFSALTFLLSMRLVCLPAQTRTSRRRTFGASG